MLKNVEIGDRVQQQHDDGCVIACFAMLSGVSYWEAHGEAVSAGLITRYGLPKMTFAAAAKLLRLKRFKCVEDEITDFRSRKLPAIVMFKWFTTPDYHSVVWDPQRKSFLDPAYPKSLGTRFYVDHWRRSGRYALVVTGKK